MGVADTWKGDREIVGYEPGLLGSGSSYRRDMRPHGNPIVAAAQEFGRQDSHRHWDVALVCEWAAIWAGERRALADAVESGAADETLTALRKQVLDSEETLSCLILGEPE